MTTQRPTHAEEEAKRHAQSPQPESPIQGPAAQPLPHPARAVQRAIRQGGTLSAAAVLHLQRTIGNQRTGHLLAEVRRPPAPAVTRAAAPSGSESMIQAKLDQTAFDQACSPWFNGVPKAWRTGMNALINAYNGYGDRKKNTQKALHAQLKMLDEIETQANDLLRTRPTQLNDTARGGIFKLLDQVEEEQTGLIARTVANQRDLWVKDSTQAGDARAVWQSILAQNKNLKIEGMRQEGELTQFGAQTLTSIAKLLQGPQGRALVKTLNDAQGVGNETRIGQDWSTAFHTQQRDYKGGSWAIPLDKNTRVAEGQKSGSYVQINSPKPTRWTDYEVGEHGEPIHSPGFVELGHELGHARSSLAGTAKSSVTWDDDAGLNDQERPLWDSPEEYQNITGTENKLRQEHGLPERIYHTTTGGVLKSKRKQELVTLLDAVEKVLTDLSVSKPEAYEKHADAYDQFRGAIQGKDVNFADDTTFKDLKSRLQSYYQVLLKEK
jgi:hypothetical protein